MKSATKVVDPHADQRKSEADKIARLRAMRLAKEAADKEAAEREATEKAAAQGAHRAQRRRKRASGVAPSAE
jgi:hypothetical protein